jgi:hypothetical protein
MPQCCAAISCAGHPAAQGACRHGSRKGLATEDGTPRAEAARPLVGRQAIAKPPAAARPASPEPGRAARFGSGVRLLPE